MNGSRLFIIFILTMMFLMPVLGDDAYAKKKKTEAEITTSIKYHHTGEYAQHYVRTVQVHKKTVPDDFQFYILIRDKEKKLFSAALPLEEFLIPDTVDSKTIQLAFPKAMYERHVKSHSALEVVWRYGPDIFDFVKVEVPFESIRSITERQ